MNEIRQIRALNKRELEEGVSPAASWHADYRDTAYIYIGGLPFELSEGDIITIFSQFGEPTFVNLIRDKETGKSKGFAFLKYEDQRSTDLAVDNLGGAVIMGRTLRVDHARYKHKEEEVAQGGIIDNSTLHKDAIKDGSSTNGSEQRKQIRGEASTLSKEEHELEAIIRDHDDDDPMKAFLIEEKKEEIALKRSQRDKGGRDDKRRHRHHHHRAHRRNDRHESRTSRDERSERDRRDHRDHHSDSRRRSWED